MKRTILSTVFVCLVALLALGSGRTINWPVGVLGFEIASGSAGSTLHIQKFGRNTDVDATGVYGPWRCAELPAAAPDLYPWDVVNGGGAIYVSSSSAGDGSGFALSVSGLNDNWELETVQVDMDGTTPVLLTNSTTAVWKRIFRAEYKDTDGGGSLGTLNTGAIYLTVGLDHTAGVPNTPANIVGCIPALIGQTEMAIYTIPEGYTGYLTQLCAGINRATSASVDVSLRVRKNDPDDKTGLVLKQTIAVHSQGGSYYCRDLDPPLKYESRTDIDFWLESSANNADVPIQFTILLKP